MDATGAPTSTPSLPRGTKIAVNMTVMYDLYTFANFDSRILRCEEYLQPSQDFDVLVGTDSPVDAQVEESPASLEEAGAAAATGNVAWMPDVLNTVFFRQQLSQQWAKAAMYLRAFHLVVIAVPTTLDKYMARVVGASAKAVALAEETDQDNGDLIVPFRVVDVDPAMGCLYHKYGTDEWLYEPDKAHVGTAAKSETYLVYTDPNRPVPRPVDTDDVPLDTLAHHMRQFLKTKCVEHARAATGNGRDSRWIMPSDFFALQQKRWLQYEQEKYTMTAEHIAAVPRLMYEMRAPADVAATFLSKSVLDSLQSVTASSDREAGQRASAHLREALTATFDVLNRIRTDVNGARKPGEPTPTGELRDEFGRPSGFDEPFMAPETVTRITQTPARTSQTVDSWLTLYIKEVAVVYGLPISVVDATYLGQPGMSAATKSTSGRATASESQMIEMADEHCKSMARENMRRWFKWLYRHTYQGVEILTLNSWLLLIREQPDLHRIRDGLRTVTKKETYAERRTLLLRLLVSVADRKKKKKKNKKAKKMPAAVPEEDERLAEGDDEAATGVPDTDMATFREMVDSLVSGKTFMPATLRFPSDRVEAEALARPIDQLSDTLVKARIEMCKMLQTGVPTGAVSKESFARNCLELLGINVEAGPDFLLEKPGA